MLLSFVCIIALWFSRCLVLGESARLDPERTPLHDVIKRRAQTAVVVVLYGHETEGLQHAVSQLLRGAEDLGHTVYRPGLRLERDLDKVARAQGLLQAQQTSCNRDALEFSFRAAAIF